MSSSVSLRPCRALRRSALAFALAAVSILLVPSPGGAQTTGSVEGRVTDAASGDPLAGITVRASTLDDPRFPGEGDGSAVTDADGRYRIEGLSPGSYRGLVFEPGDGYISQIYPNVDCPFLFPEYPDGCELFLSTAGERFDVAAGGTVADVSFALNLGGVVTGIVRDAQTGDPVRTHVGITSTGGDETTVVKSVGSGADGRFRIDELPAGGYVLVAFATEGYFLSVTGGVSVSLGTVTEFDLTVQPWTTISGTVTEVGTGNPIPGEFVSIYDSTGQYAASATLMLDGSYVSEPVPAGTYYVTSSVGFGRQPWVDQLYGGGDCLLYLGCDVTAGDPVVVTEGGSVRDIDLELPVGGTISGRVLIGDQPGEAEVRFFAPDGTPAGSLRSDPTDGTYEVQGLPQTSFFMTADFHTASPELYEEMACGPAGSFPTCDVTGGTPVAATLGGTTPDIDFTLDAIPPPTCTPGPGRLCLNRGRFAVEIGWETPAGQTGAATAVELFLGDDSGYFWFFDENNVEVVVKVLDACETSFNSFWVFAAGLTNVQVEMTVTDTLTGDVRTYTNLQQTPFQPLLDTRAFDTCDAAPGDGARTVEIEAAGLATVSDPWTAETLAPGGSFQDLLFRPKTEARRLLELAGERRQGDCVRGITSLCLQEGRFQVEAQWTKPDGSSGPATAHSLRGDTGLFTFFRRDNVEVVVKVLSNCGGRSNHFWVFAGGLTNLDVLLTVTDTVTGAVRTYRNPQGEAFQPIQDTRAFDTCGST